MKSNDLFDSPLFIPIKDKFEKIFIEPLFQPLNILHDPPISLKNCDTCFSHIKNHNQKQRLDVGTLCHGCRYYSQWRQGK